jgi:hypothetical protein
MEDGMGKNVNRIDHVVAAVRPENLESAIAKLSMALQTAFYGPFDREDSDIRVAVSWDAGIELITPISAANPLHAHLERCGEGWFTVLFGVRDVDDTCERLKRLGHEPVARYSGISGVEPWVDRFERFDEAMFEPSLFAGLSMGFATAEERSAD